MPDALGVAVPRRGPAAGVVAYSDRGTQYASDHDQRVSGAAGMPCGMSGVGQCGDNAVAEGTVGQIKRELVRHETDATRDEARASIVESVGVSDNRVRRHSPLGYTSPDEYERTHDPNHRS
jgi:putative transposase